MAYPASQERLGKALERVAQIALSLSNRCQALRDDSAVGDVARPRIQQLLQHLGVAIATWNEATLMPGIGDYAQAEYGDPTLDVAAEFTAMLTEAVSLSDWIVANFPTASGAWLMQSFNAQGDSIPLTFGTAELAQFRTRCDLLLATIG